MQGTEDLSNHSIVLHCCGPGMETGKPDSGVSNESKVSHETYSMQDVWTADQELGASRYAHEAASEQVSSFKLETGHGFDGMVGRGDMPTDFNMYGKNNRMDGFHVTNRNVPQHPLHPYGSYAAVPGDGSMVTAAHQEAPTRFLWIGNLTLKATRPMLCTVFEKFGLLEDLVTFPGRMYAFVTYQGVESAMKALHSIQGAVIKDITGEKGMVIKYRSERKASMHGSGGSRDSSSCRGSSTATSDADMEPSPRIWLGNITPTATAANLQSVLGRFGNLIDAAVFPARIGPLGYAFVKFERLEDAINAYNTLNNAIVPALSGTKQVKMRYKPVSEGVPARDSALDALQASIPSRHIWIGNVTQKPSEDTLIEMFNQFGNIESARVFSAKSYAFVNFYDVGSAIEAITKLDGVSVPVLTGLKPLVIRYQHESNSATIPSNDQSLNPKMREVLARSRAVPDSQQCYVNSEQDLQADSLPDYSIASSLGIDEHPVAHPFAEHHYHEASRISAMLQNLASLAPPNITKYSNMPPGFAAGEEQRQMKHYLNQNVWMDDEKSNWESSSQSVVPKPFQSWDLRDI